MAANVATNAAIEMGMIDHIVMGTAMNSTSQVLKADSRL